MYEAGADHVSATQAGVPQVLSTTLAEMTGGAESVACVNEEEYAESPAADVAATRKSYVVATVSPVTVIEAVVEAVCEKVVHVPDGEVRY